MRRLALFACLALALLFVPRLVTTTQAHPHVFVEARSALVFADDGRAIAVRHAFRFDDAFSAFAIQGFDKNGDGVYSREELSELAQVNIESMADFGYFTFGDNGRIELDFSTPPEGYYLEVVDVPINSYWAIKPEDLEAMAEDVRMNGGEMPETVQLLELHFTLPLKEPSDASEPITLDVYDPTYYVDFRFAAGEGATSVANAPGTCQVERRDPPKLDDATAFALAQIGPDQRDLPPELQSAASSQVNQMIVRCAQALAETPSPSQQPTAESVNGIPAAVVPDSSLASSNPNDDVAVGPLDYWFGTIAALQQDFYQKLIGAMRSFRANPNAGWLLIGLSFAYGVFHAAGPGHGKAIISSYVVANNETLKKGVALSFVSAFAQAVTAVLLVGGAAVVLNLTSIAIQDTARWFEIGSYALVMLLGLYLLWQKALRPWLRGDGGHDHHDHGHHDHHHNDDHDHHHNIGNDGVCSTCGHAHAPTPDMVQGRLSLTRAASIVVAVGLRPCSGALIVLVFALAQGMMLAGIAATFAMALGTGITVAVLAGMAVGARDLAVRLFGDGSVIATRIHRTIEVAGALIVFLLGLSLLVAAIGWG
ncbi:DUF1007 family protein [Roseibium sp.]|uniref:HoxN/HupN/NixA family nickel/cobalt transporter n=1 Tax=Roseibium sp. TaxID=1936156 RepID=UPI003A987454